MAAVGLSTVAFADVFADNSYLVLLMSMPAELFSTRHSLLRLMPYAFTPYSSLLTPSRLSPDAEKMLVRDGLSP